MSAAEQAQPTPAGDRRRKPLRYWTRSSKPLGHWTKRRPIGPRTTSASSSTRSSSRARSSPRTSRPTSSSGSARSTRSSPPSSTRSCTTPTSRSWKATWRGLHYLVNQSRDRAKRSRSASSMSANASCSRTWKRPSSSTRARCSRRSTRRSTATRRPAVRHAGRRLRVRPHRRGHRLLKMISGRGRRGPCAVRRRRRPRSMFNFDRFTELTTPRDLAKIFNERRVRRLEVVPRIGGLALRRPDLAARAGPAALRRELQAGRRVQLRGVRRRQGPRQVPVDECRLGLRRAHHRRLRQVRLDGGTRGVEGGGKVEGLPVHTFPTDDGDVAMKCPTEIAISDRREFELSNLGFLPLVAQQEPRLRRLHGGAVVPEAEDRTSTRPPTPTPSCRPSST